MDFPEAQRTAALGLTPIDAEPALPVRSADIEVVGDSANELGAGASYVSENRHSWIISVQPQVKRPRDLIRAIVIRVVAELVFGDSNSCAAAARNSMLEPRSIDEAVGASAGVEQHHPHFALDT